MKTANAPAPAPTRRPAPPRFQPSLVPNSSSDSSSPSHQTHRESPQPPAALEPSPSPPPALPIAPPSALGFLKDAIQEVAYANYFLSRYQLELSHLCPGQPGDLLESAQPETPAERAHRLATIQSAALERLHSDLERVTAALDQLAATGLADLEEAVHHSRRLLAQEVIVPNLPVLRMDQDGGVRSPFRDLDIDGIINAILLDPTQETGRMHQAERLLRGCNLVQRLQRDHRHLGEWMSEASARSALDRSSQTLDTTAQAWGLPALIDPPEIGPHHARQNALAQLQSELRRRASRLTDLGARLGALGPAAADLKSRITAAIPALFDSIPAAHLDPDPCLDAWFAPDAPLGRLAVIHGFLPVAQALREHLAQTLDDLASSVPPSDTPASQPCIPLDSIRLLPGALSGWIRLRFQQALREDPQLVHALHRHAISQINRGLADDLAGIAVRLGFVDDSAHRRVLSPAEAAGNIHEAIARIEAALRQPSLTSSSAPSASPDPRRHPVVLLLDSLAHRIRHDDLPVDEPELNGLLDDAFDYVRRRAALQEFTARRQAYVAQGWSTGSRQKRMEKPLKDGLPTLSELGAIDAELTEVFNVLQSDLESFLESADFPVTQALHSLASLEQALRHSLPAMTAEAPASHAAWLDPEFSPVVAGLTLLFRRLRNKGEEASTTPPMDALDALIAEVRQLTATAPVYISHPTIDATWSLCRTAGLDPIPLVGLAGSPDHPAPVLRYLKPVARIDP